ncbi:MAG: hypothetical protein A2451_03720 [Bdellovibrionales bacterium RIFOXYC2_FULL_39_8]|nr:MAG: hypothetical protein A2451_03720 [Bdellovibrionales bacterium RIFOXYC2_FULL_39_8]
MKMQKVWGFRIRIVCFFLAAGISLLVADDTTQNLPPATPENCLSNEQIVAIKQLPKESKKSKKGEEKKGSNGKKAFAGFPKLIECQGLLATNVEWKSISANPSTMTKAENWTGFSVSDNSITFLKANCNRNLEENESKVDNKCSSECPDKLKNLQEDISAYLEKVQECAGFAVIMKGTDYDADYNGFKVKNSVDDAIKCESQGHITQDYPACATMVNFYDGFFVGQQIGTAVQQVDFGLKTQELQKDAMKNQQEGDYLAGLKAQEKSVRKQADLANQQGVFHGTKLATLMTMYKKIPGDDEINEKIQPHEESIKQLYASLNDTFKVVTIFGGTDDKNSSESEFPSLVLAYTTFINHRGIILANTKSRDQLRMAMVKAGVDMTVALGQGALLNNQADDIADAMGTIDAASFPDLAWDQKDLLATKCAMDPTAEGCGLVGVGQQHDIAGADLTINGFGPNETGQYGTDGSLPVDPSAAAAGSDSSLDKVGSIVDNTKDKSKGVPINPPGGLVSGGGAGGGVPGGGGGGFGGAGSPGGGGDGGGGRGPASESSLTVPKYSFASGGSEVGFARNGGAKSKEENKNPFSNLFGGKKDDKDSNNVMSFRELASVKEKGNIFERISRRYTIISGSKRLLEYEVVDSGKSDPNK